MFYAIIKTQLIVFITLGIAMNIKDETLKIINLFADNDKFKKMHDKLLKCHNDNSKNASEKFIATLEKLVPGIAKEEPNLRAYGFILLGHQKFITGDYPGALEAYNKSIETDKKIFDSYYFAGLCRMKSGYFHSSVAYFKAAVKLNASSVPGKFQLGRAYYHHYDYQAAVGYFNDLIDSGENLASEVYFYRGLCFRDLKKYNLAIKDFNKARQLDPQNNDAVFSIKLIEKEINFLEK